MNPPLRRLGAVIGLMLLAIMLATTAVQFFQAPSLTADARNTRNIYRQWSIDRGQIVVAGNSIVRSERTNHEMYKYQRIYQSGPLYAHLTGYFSVAHNASTGVERAEDQILSGASDSLLLSRIQTLFTGRQPQGGSVELTINPAVQETMARLFGDQRGAAVVLDPRSGAILGMYSSPSYDPNQLASHSRQQVDESYQALVNNEAKPLNNRATGDVLYAPGSTFKTLVTAAYLEAHPNLDVRSQVLTARELKLPQSSAVIHNPGGSNCGPNDQGELIFAFQHSCNTTFAKLAMDLGDEALRAMAQKLGFESNLRIPLQVRHSTVGATNSAAEVALAGIGQMNVRVSVLQNAMLASAVANDGVLMQPHLVSTTRDADLAVISQTKPTVLSTAFSKATAAKLTELMTAVVENGTGKPARITGVKVAGKTGTAESGTNKPQHAWMIAFAPADNPRVAVALVLEHGGTAGSDAYGGTTAGPLVRQILEVALR